MPIFFGKYELRFIPPAEQLPPIGDTLWENHETKFRDENIIWLSSKSEPHSGLGYQAFAQYCDSWLLARLWRLSDGEIRVGLSLSDLEKGVGWQDGGAYDADCTVHQDGTLVGHVMLSGGGFGYIDLRLTECYRYANPDEICQALADKLWEHPEQVAVCLIEIRDPEQNGKPYYYGWDGTNFMPLNEELA